MRIALPTLLLFACTTPSDVDVEGDTDADTDADSDTDVDTLSDGCGVEAAHAAGGVNVTIDAGSAGDGMRGFHLLQRRGHAVVPLVLTGCPPRPAMVRPPWRGGSVWSRAGGVLFVVFLVGCSGDSPKETGTPDTDSGTDAACGTVDSIGGDASCGNTPPVITGLIVENLGMATGSECQGLSVPVVRIIAEFEDEDGDLHDYDFSLWWDDVVDGCVEPTGLPASDLSSSLSDTPCDMSCDVSEGGAGVRYCLDGEGIPFATEVELGAVIFDVAGNASNGGELFVQAFTMPGADGT
jgi:hypothetical protein